MLTKNIEALILASDEPLSFDKLRTLLEPIESSDVRDALSTLEHHYADRGVQLKQIAGGWQFRTDPSCANIVKQLWQTRPARLSRSMLETLAIIAYQQPTTRAEIESLRGIKVSSSIIGGLLERSWIKVLGRKDVPGRPHLYGTSKQFLADFGLTSLQDLPDSSQLMDTSAIQQEKLNLPYPTQTTEHNHHE
ncbi:MAG: SMC-Scp complex subunit ScpB [Mariprofundaceae bacterium]|nr:SMC-Scp complex subunit ScpB [Mariprofundaceae bacterium]